MKNKKLLIIVIAAVAVVATAVVIFLSSRGEKPIVYAYYSPGEFFVTNVNASAHLLKTSVVLVLNTEDTKLQDELKLQNAKVRDTIIFLLRDLTEEDIKSADNKEKLRKDIIEQLNDRLEIDNIVDVWFNDFVMQ
jgi:flagellar basal body-associated protein FliL